MLECGNRIFATNHSGHKKSTKRHWFVKCDCELDSFFNYNVYYVLNRFNFSAIKSISCWTSMRTPVRMVPLFMAIHMKTCIGTNVIWCFRNYWPRIQPISLPKMLCSMPTSGKVVRHDVSAASDYPIRSIRIRWRCRCADFNWKGHKSSHNTQKKIVSGICEATI